MLHPPGVLMLDVQSSTLLGIGESALWMCLEWWEVASGSSQDSEMSTKTCLSGGFVGDARGRDRPCWQQRLCDMLLYTGKVTVIKRQRAAAVAGRRVPASVGRVPVPVPAGEKG